MGENWWEAPFRTFQTNLREIDAGLDVERTLDKIQEYGADTWLLSVGGIVSNYPSRLDSQTVNPALTLRDGGDLISDAVDAARTRGVRLLGRMDFSKIDARRAEQHPQWCFVSPEGELQTYNGYRSVCPSGDYYQREMFSVVEEVLERYPLSGFFFNWMSFNEVDYSRRYWGVCHCEACRRDFTSFAPDLSLPSGPGDAGYETWRRFSNGVLDDLNSRMRKFIGARFPETALILGDSADITFHEANNAVGRPLWHLETTERVSAARSGRPDRPVFVNAVGFVDIPYRWAGEDPNHFAQYLVQAIAHGAQPSTYIMGTPDDVDYEALEVGGRITRFHRDHDDLYRGLRSTAKVALVKRSGRGPTPEWSLDEFRGHCLSLVERHVPFDVLRQDRLTGLDGSGYSLLILPDIGPLGDDELDAVNRFLAGGGTVVATGGSGWQEGLLQIGSGSPLAVQRAAYGTEEAVRSLHLPVGPGGALAPVVGGFAVLEPAEGAEADWLALGRAPHGPPEKCFGHVGTEHPGWVDGAVGEGHLVLVPWRPGLVYRELGLSAVRDAFVGRVLEVAGRDLAARTDLPAAVHVVAGGTQRSTVLHLLNRSGDAVQRFTEPLRIGEGSISWPMAEEPEEVIAHVAGIPLPWDLVEGVLTIRTPELGRFEVVEIRHQSVIQE